MLIAFNKPFNVVCKFSPEPGRSTLADYIDIRTFIQRAGSTRTAKPAAADR